MSAYHDGQTYPASASARWRQGCGRDFHRRSGQTRHFVPASRDRPSGKLHPRRILGIIRYNFQTVFPPTIVRTARPLSFQPSNGELRDADSNLSTLTVHSKSGSINVTSAAAPIDNVPALIFNRRLGFTVYISIKRTMSILRCL